MKNKGIFALSALALGIGSALAAPRPHYDASLEPVPAALSADTPLRGAAVRARGPAAAGPGGVPVDEDPRLGTATFLWAAPGEAGEVAASARAERAARAERLARDFLGHNGVRLGLRKRAIAAARLHELHDTGRGPLIARFQQMHDGVEVFGRRLNVMLDRMLRPVAASGYFAADNDGDPDTRAADTGSHRDPARAIAAAVADLGGRLDPAILETLGERDGYTRFRAGIPAGNYRLDGTPRAKRVLFPLGGHLLPAWYLEVELSGVDGGEHLAYGYVVSVRDGRILFRNDHSDHAAFGYRVFADADALGMPFDSALGDERIPLPALDPNLDLPRVPVAANLLTLESGPIATADPWLADDADETVGNNVDAYANLGGGDGLQPAEGDFRAPLSGPYRFDYPIVADGDPTTADARHGAVVNLFYVNNFLHDWWYGNGFDEAAGNAQADNYGRGGRGGDPILAESQDHDGRNNSNMITPADGASPRMSMYLWDGPAGSGITASAEGVGQLTAVLAEFGPQTFDLTGNLVAVTPADACTALTAPAAVAGNIALIDRGTCLFSDKVANAQAAGAIGAIVANDVDDGSAQPLGGYDTSITIPALGISFADGAHLRSALAAGPVRVTLHRERAIDRDGSFDNGIIAHEWFHYVSERLVGDSNGLGNGQGSALAEGWSDIAALLLAVRPEDAAVAANAGFRGAYPVANYVATDAYFGLRRAPYSTDPAVFPLTFKHIVDDEPLPADVPLRAAFANSEYHNAGEIWANTLWDFYASLLTDGRHTFREAQERMKDYLITSLKMTPNNPTYLEARDALLAAARATDTADFELAANSFAKYGMGVGARAPERDAPGNVGVVESYLALAATYEVVQTTLDVTTQGNCDADGVLDAGERALLRVRIRDIGNLDLPQGLKARVVSRNNAVTLGNGGRIAFGPFDADGIATGRIPVTLGSVATAATVRLDIRFPQVGDSAEAVLEPPPVHYSASVNYDLVKAFTSDDVERTGATTGDWTRSHQASVPDGDWRVTGSLDALMHSGQVWYVPDNDRASESTLTSPAITVGEQPFALSFDTAYRFEADPQDCDNISCDGGVVEVSVDGGRWRDVLAAGGHFTRGGYNTRVSALSASRQGYGGSLPQLTAQTIDFGTALAGHRVRLRFRAASDAAVGDFGWLVDNIAVSGAADLPFSDVVDNAATCGEGAG